MKSTSGGEAIVNGLVAHGVDTVFGLPGAQTYGLFDAFHQAQLKVIGARHEHACGYMAFGYARSSGRPGVFSVVPGPGILNAGAALLTAFGCNEPVLCLTGQVPTAFRQGPRPFARDAGSIGDATHVCEMGRAHRVSRPCAFDGIARISGNVVGPPRAGVAGNAVGRVHAARAGRPLQGAGCLARAAADPDRIKEAAALIKDSKRPLIFVGSGASMRARKCSNLPR